MNPTAASFTREEHSGDFTAARPEHARPDIQAGKAGAVGRRFLLVSAPFGPFSRELAAELRHAGAGVSRMLLNAGDIFDWGLKDGVPFFGGIAAWDNWLKDLVRRDGFTDIVTYGDSSPHANRALGVANELKLRTHVLEQGYFRPDWVTLEARGVNGNSDLPHDPAWYRHHAAAQAAPKDEIVGRTTPAAVRHIVAYHLAMYLGAPAFPRFKAHYMDRAYKQAAGHIVRYGIEPLSHSRARRTYEDLVQTDDPVFLCLLQRPGDSQLWRHSKYASVPAFIEHVLTSFAAYAPKNARVLIRRHPLDPGLVRYRPILSSVARRLGLEGRVCLTDYGKLHEILPRMAGAVCVNSTAGLAAIEFGTPTITLGSAIYDLPGLTHQGGLDSFWNEPQKPDAELYLAFRHVVMAETQINGAYATENGRRLAVPMMASRMLSAPART
jgi:capsular polysaccharide export protein